MKNPNYYTWQIIILCILSSFLGMIVGVLGLFLYSETNIIMPMKKEAVDRGFASWEVIDNANGQTKFTWKDQKMMKQVEDMFANLEKPLGSFSEDFTEK